MTTLISSNLVNELSTTLVFGFGYYLFQSIQKKLSRPKPKPVALESDDEEDWFEENNDQVDPATKKLKSLKSKMEGALSRWSYAKTLEDYHKLIKTEYKDIEDPFAIISQMHNKGIIPTIETYNYLLYSNYAINNQSKANELLDEILDETIPVYPDVYTLNIVIKGICMKYKNNSELFDKELAKMLTLFESKGVYLDITTQNSILESLVEMNRIEEMWNHYISMKSNFSPDFETIKILIRGIVSIGTEKVDKEWLNKAFDLINDSKMINIVDLTTFNFLIESCVKFNIIDKMENIYNDYSNQIVLCEKSYITLINGFSKIYQFDKAYDIFEKIPSSQKTTEIYIAIIQCAIRCQSYSTAEKIFNEINEEDKTSEIYNLYIYLYKSKGYYSKPIEEIFDNKIKNNNLKCIETITLFNSLLDCACKSKNIDKIKEIYEFINNSQLKCDNTTYSIMLQAYASANLTKELTNLLDKIKDQCSIDEVLYNKIISSYIQNKEEDKAVELFQEMKKKNHDINSYIYNEIIKIYINSKNATKSFELFDECVKNDQKLTKETYVKLIKLQIESTYLDRAMTLFRNMFINKVERDPETYEMIIEACFSNSMVKEACEFSIKALQENMHVDKEIYINLPELINCADNNELKYYEKIEIAQTIVDLMSKAQSEYSYSFKIIDKFIMIAEGRYEKREKHRDNRQRRNNYRNKNCANQNQKESSLYDVALHNNCDVTNENSNNKSNRNKGNKKKKNQRNNYNNTSIYQSNYQEEKSIYA